MIYVTWGEVDQEGGGFHERMMQKRNREIPLPGIHGLFHKLS